ncbi:MAG TPA: hypothetical protein VGL35_05975 [Rhizomicrobium sp.]|jgi:hypothetical protein
MIADPRSGLAVLACLALIVPTGSASAGSTATRCDAHGCVHIHCNPSGDRCYRYGDEQFRHVRGACGDCGLGPGERVHGLNMETGGHLVCDPAGDRCYSSDAPHWDYREYYRRHGFRWEN